MYQDWWQQIIKYHNWINTFRLATVIFASNFFPCTTKSFSVLEILISTAAVFFLEETVVSPGALRNAFFTWIFNFLRRTIRSFVLVTLFKRSPYNLDKVEYFSGETDSLVPDFDFPVTVFFFQNFLIISVQVAYCRQNKSWIATAVHTAHRI